MFDISSILQFLSNLLIFLVGLSVLVLVHEFGHFLAAKRVGIKVEEFGLGFPPKVFKWRRGETEYSINALPFGGFVRLYGEEHSVKKEKNRSFYHQSRDVRTSVIVAGVVMNLLLAIVVFTGLYSILGVPTQTKQSVVITYIFPDSPAQAAEVQPLDRIDSIAGEKVTDIEQVKGLTDKNKGREIEYVLERSELIFLANEVFEQGERQKVAVRVTPRETPPENQGPVGIGLDELTITNTRTYPWYEMPYRATVAGLGQSFKFTGDILKGLGSMLQRLVVRGEVPKDIAGPVGIFQITSVAASAGGVLTLLSLLGVLSINLAVLNILPFPALDGGRLVFIIMETIFRRRVFPHYEQIAHQVGMALLIGLILLITFADIRRIIG